MLLLQILPRDVDNTDVVLTWLVDACADEGGVDLERLTWMWDVTVTQDTAIIEGNAQGVKSMAHVPGPYGKLERKVARLACFSMNTSV